MNRIEDIQNDLNNAMDLIIHATSKILKDYFNPELWRIGLGYRERIYCYELYHQMRTEMENIQFSVPYVINGELDKAGTYQGILLKPDFIFHIPGDTEHNLLAIEVKRGPQLKMLSLRKDISNLNFLINELGYEKGIMLIFGPLNILTRSYIENSSLKDITFLHHEFPSKPAKVVPE
jgi:hypothetical protein